MKKRILYIASVYVHIRDFHLPYIKGLAERGYSVDVACCNCAAEIDGAENTFNISFEKNFLSLRNFWESLHLRRLIKENKYDLILCHTSLASFFTRLAVLGCRKRPAVCNMVHGYLFDDNTPWLKRTILSAAEKLTAPVTDLIITMNDYDTVYARKRKLAPRIEKVDGVGLDPDKLRGRLTYDRETARAKLGIAPDRFVLLCVGEFSSRKSQHVLIEAMWYLPEKVVLAMPGAGALWTSCKDLSKTLGGRHRVILPGYTREIGLWLSAADVMVSASRSEGLPFSIMEAMEFGLPVIASNVKGHCDLITHGENGYLYPYGDCKAYAKMVLNLMCDLDKRKSFGLKSAERVKKHYLSCVYETIMRQYERLL